MGVLSVDYFLLDKWGATSNSLYKPIELALYADFDPFSESPFLLKKLFHD